MQKESPKKQIFQTQPKFNIPSYDQFLKQVKNYTFNLNHHLNQAINDQNKSIKRKRIELEKQLQYLKQKHFTQRKKIREMEQFFTYYCENPLKNDINKWNEHQNYFQSIFEQNYNEVQIQTQINKKNQQKITLLKLQLKHKMKSNLKQAVTQRLQLQHLSKSKNFRTKKSFSTKIERKSTKMNTEPSQATDFNDFERINFNRKQKIYTEADQKELKNISRQTEQLIRVKTQMSLPTLKKSTFLDPSRIKNDEFNFMKPIGTIKKGLNSDSILPEIIKFFQQHKKKLQTNDSQMDWFQKVVFNNRNFEKLIEKLNDELKLISGKKRTDKSQNKVTQLVAKNLFRLKTQSTIETNQSKLFKSKETSTKKRILSFSKNQSLTERFQH